MTVTFLKGNALDVLKTMPDGSAHTFVTSPPYFGARNYGTDPQVWAPVDGKSPCRDLEHEWGATVIRRTDDKPTGMNVRGGGTIDRRDVDSLPRFAFCAKCGAWRGELGQEPTVGLYIAHLVAIFRETRRVLRDDGVGWVNIADSWAGAGYSNHTGTNGATGDNGKQKHLYGSGMKSKSACLIPERLVIALADDGWIVRIPIVWAKGVSFLPQYAGTAMPESVEDRPSKSFEMIYMLVKSNTPKFWVHRDGLGTRVAPKADWRWADRLTGIELDAPPHGNWKAEMIDNLGGEFEDDGERENDAGVDPPERIKRYKRLNLWSARDYFYDKWAVVENALYDGRTATRLRGSNKYADGVVPGESAQSSARKGGERWTLDDEGVPKRNLRACWVINPEPSEEKHYAMMPTLIPQTCIKSSTSERGVCPRCGAGYARQAMRDVREYEAGADGANDGSNNKVVYAKNNPHRERLKKERKLAGHLALSDSSMLRTERWNGIYNTVAWHPTCECNAGEPVPSVVLDFFGGSGTTAVVARRLGRDAVLIDLKDEYIEIQKRKVANALRPPGTPKEQASLFE